MSGLPVIIQGLGGRNKIDAPTATWEAAESFLDRATAAGRARLLDADRAAVRPPGRDRRDEPPLPRGAVVGPHAEAAARGAGRAAARSGRARRAARRGRALQPRSRRRARPSRRRCGTRCSSTRSRSPSTQKLPVALDRATSPTSSASRPPTRMLDLALAEDLATEFRWRTESPEWTAAVGEAQRDARMMIGVSDGGAHLARDDGADWSSYFLRSWVLDREVWTLEEGIRQITQIPAALVGLADRGTLAPGGPADLIVFDPETIGPWKKEFVHDLPGGVGRFKAWGRGVQATVVNGEPIVLRGELTGRLPGQVVRPAVTPGGDLGALGLRRRRARRRAAARSGTSSFPRSSAASRPCGAARRPLPLRVRRPHRASACPDAPRRWARRARPHETDAPVAVRGGSEPAPAARRHGRRPHRCRRAVPDVRADDPGRHRARARGRVVPRDQRLGGRVLRARPRAVDRRRDAADDRRRRRARRGAPLRGGARLPRGVAPARALRLAPAAAGRGVRAALVVPRGGERAVRDPSRHERARAVRRARRPLRRLLHPVARRALRDGADARAHHVRRVRDPRTPPGLARRVPRDRRGVGDVVRAPPRRAPRALRLRPRWPHDGAVRLLPSAVLRVGRGGRARPRRRCSPSTPTPSCSRRTTRTPTAPSPGRPPSCCRATSSRRPTSPACCADNARRLYGLDSRHEHRDRATWTLFEAIYGLRATRSTRTARSPTTCSRGSSPPRRVPAAPATPSRGSSSSSPTATSRAS